MRRFVILFIILAAVGVALYLALSSPKPPPVAVVPKAQRDAAEKRLASALTLPSTAPLNAGLASSTKRAAGAPAPDLELHFAADDIDTVLASDPKAKSELKQHDVQALQVRFDEPNRIHFDVWVGPKGAAHEVGLEGTLTPDGSGGMSFHTDKTEVGLLPVPTDITGDQIDHQISGFLAYVQPKIPIEVQSIVVKDNELTLSGPKKN